MIALPKLILIILVAGLAWYALRWLNRAPPARAAHRRETPPRPQSAAVEDLTQCKTCGAYVAAGAHACGKAGCPLLP